MTVKPWLAMEKRGKVVLLAEASLGGRNVSLVSRI